MTTKNITYEQVRRIKCHVLDCEVVSRRVHGFDQALKGVPMFFGIV